VTALVRERVRVHPRARHWPLAVRAVPGAVRADPQAIRQAVDVLLNDVGLRQPESEPRVSVDTCELEEAEAARLQLDSGCYVRLGIDVAAARPDAHRTLDETVDELEMLLALAAVREFGGTIVNDRADATCGAIYLPVAVA
jgi:hypothetical protein